MSPAKAFPDGVPQGAKNTPRLAPSAGLAVQPGKPSGMGASDLSKSLKKGPQSAATLAPEFPPQALDIDRVCVQLSQLIGLDLDDVQGRGSEREDVAAEVGISLHRVNKWAAASKPDHLPPVQFLPLWVRATASPRLLRWAVEEAGYRLATEQDMKNAAVGRKLRELAAAVFGEVAA